MQDLGFDELVSRTSSYGRAFVIANDADAMR